MLAKDNIKLAIDPLKGIAAAPARETAETARAELFLRWEVVSRGAHGLSNMKARLHFIEKCRTNFKKFQVDNVLAQKTTLLASLDRIDYWVRYCQQHPDYVPGKVWPASETLM
jgi:hypothetical protein